MKIVTAKQMQEVDKGASERFGIPAIILMENAAIVSSFCALRMLKPKETKVVFFCGQGNNGGDGFACARHLINRGLKVKVYFIGKQARLSKESIINYRILSKMGQKIYRPNISLLKKELSGTDLVVDALLGIGLKDKVREPYFSLIEVINDAQRPVLSLDIPSGLDASTGRVQGVAIKARRTITFGLLKKGFLYPQVQAYLGEVTVGDISLPRKILF